MRRASSRLRLLVRQSGGSLTPQLLSQAAALGDQDARGVWSQMGHALGIGLANIINIFNPERIVIGGGIANAWRWFAPAMNEVIQREAIGVSRRSVRIVRAQLGSRAGMIGAAVLVWERVRKS